MNNREKYIQAYSAIEPSADFARKVLEEAEKMNNTGRKKFNSTYKRKAVVVAASFIMVFSLTTGAYAANVGGFKSNVQSWLYGEATQVQVEQIGEYEYEITYPDGSVRGTGGAVSDGNGGMRAATPEEVIEHINNEIIVEENDQNRVILYYHDHAEDITDKLDERNIVHVKFKDGALPTYIVLQWHGNGGYVCSEGHFGYNEIDERDLQNITNK